MRVLFLTNNNISDSLVDWLRDSAKEEVIVSHDKISKETIESCKPDVLISYNYRYIIKKDVLDCLKNRALNLHISLLPWNRGADPNLWSFLEDTPKGVTIHIMDEGIDTGDILLQKEVYFDDQKETLSSSYMALHRELQVLFMSNWDKIETCQIVSKPQPSGGSTHFKRDFERINHILGDEGWNIKIPELKKRYKRLLQGERL
jgi:methionyl-tRNA formyltransferase